MNAYLVRILCVVTQRRRLQGRAPPPQPYKRFEVLCRGWQFQCKRKCTRYWWLKWALTVISTNGRDPLLIRSPMRVRIKWLNKSTTLKILLPRTCVFSVALAKEGCLDYILFRTHVRLILTGKQVIRRFTNWLSWAWRLGPITTMPNHWRGN